MVERLALGQSSNDYGDEGDDKEGANRLQSDFVFPFPEARGKSFQKFRNGEFSRPDAAPSH
jgi:hypothetical protein